MAAESKVNVGVNSVQYMCQPSGLIGPDGKIKSNLSLDSGDGSRFNVDAKMFPFIVPTEPVFVVVSIFQVRPAEELIATPSKGLIIPGN